MTAPSTVEMSETPIKMVPDGGYGWVVCAVVFVIAMVSEGTIFCYGVIMPEIIKAFECSSSTAAFIGALQSGMLYFVAMFVVAIANKSGCRCIFIFKKHSFLFTFVVHEGHLPL